MLFFESLGEVFTLTLQVSFSPLISLAVTVTVPFLSAVTVPLETLATALFEDIQVFTTPFVTFNKAVVPALRLTKVLLSLGTFSGGNSLPLPIGSEQSS